MKRLYIFFTTAIIISTFSFLFGCSSVPLRSLTPDGINLVALPPLEPQIDVESFETAYPLSGTIVRGSVGAFGAPALGGVVSAGSFSGVKSERKDIRLQDTAIIFERDVRNNICLTGDVSAGYAICKIAAAATNSGGLGYAFLSGCTLGLLNLCGMPAAVSKMDLDVEVELRDIHNNTIGRYQGYGTGTAYWAAWWGYDSASFTRVSNIEAFKMAMQSIKNNINRDAPRLIRKLNDNH